MKISKLGENGVYKNILFQFSPLYQCKGQNYVKKKKSLSCELHMDIYLGEKNLLVLSSKQKTILVDCPENR